MDADALVLFGATGDLAKKKLYPALYELERRGRLEIPVVGTGDTNVDPDELAYIIPGNDDAIRSVSLVTRVIADALAEGRRAGREAMVTGSTGPEITPEAGGAA